MNDLITYIDIYIIKIEIFLNNLNLSILIHFNLIINNHYLIKYHY